MFRTSNYWTANLNKILPLFFDYLILFISETIKERDVKIRFCCCCRVTFTPFNPGRPVSPFPPLEPGLPFGPYYKNKYRDK